MFKYFRNISFTLILLLVAATAYAAESLKVVTTTTFFKDLVKKIGKNHVEVHAVAPPKFNVHFIQPKPSDVRKLAKADLYVYAGLDLEAWSDPLVEAAGKTEFFRGGSKAVDMSKGISLLEVPTGVLSRASGDLHLFGNPHYTLNPENARIMAVTITDKLKDIDPDHSDEFQKNLEEFLSTLRFKISEWKELSVHLRGREIVSYHNDIVYMAEFLGLQAKQFLEVKPGIPPTPRHLQFLEEYIPAKQISAILVPTYYSKDAAEALSRKVGTKIVTICQNVGELPGTEDIFSFFDFNFNQINAAMRPQG